MPLSFTSREAFYKLMSAHCTNAVIGGDQDQLILCFDTTLSTDQAGAIHHEIKKIIRDHSLQDLNLGNFNCTQKETATERKTARDHYWNNTQQENLTDTTETITPTQEPSQEEIKADKAAKNMPFPELTTATSLVTLYVFGKETAASDLLESLKAFGRSYGLAPERIKARSQRLYRSEKTTGIHLEP